MSLKAKIEAVIYASEEPVTLAQLIGLLGEEGQAELDAIAAQQHSLTLVGATPHDPPDAQTGLAADAEADLDASLEAPPQDPDPSALSISSAATGAPLKDSGPARYVDQPQETEKEADPEAGLSTSAGALTDDIATTSEAPATPANAPSTDQPSEASQKLAARRLREYFRFILDQLIADYANGDRGLEIREVASGFRLATKPEFHDAVRGFVKSLKPPLKLSLQALETLAVVAYKQPITAPEVSEIRGVDSAGVLGSLLARKLIATAGRKQVIGRPILYKTTKEFLLRFGLKDINELPSIEEFERIAGELNDAVQEEIPMEAESASDSDAVAESQADDQTEVESPASVTAETEPSSDSADASNIREDGTGIREDQTGITGTPSEAQ
jgi:segregation and condensation protein B